MPVSTITKHDVNNLLNKKHLPSVISTVIQQKSVLESVFTFKLAMPEVKEAQISYDICGIYMIYIWDIYFPQIYDIYLWDIYDIYMGS